MTHDDALLSGIDEAGYGPLLGPLVVARADFCGRSEEEIARLAKDARLGVDDSKKVHSGKRGLAKLERVVMAFAADVLGRAPANLDEWLDFSLDREWRRLLDLHPWYRDRDVRWPLAASADEIAKTTESLAAHNLGFRGFRLALTPEIEFNRRLKADMNKHDALFGDVRALIQDVMAKKNLITVDKLGGRDRYRQKIEESFPFVVVDVLGESRRESRYRLTLPHGTAEWAFLMKGDARSFLVALASMAAKFTREALMIVFNRHFAGLVPGISPTAGYYVDGCRFVRDLEAAGRLDVATRAMLVRDR